MGIQNDNINLEDFKKFFIGSLENIGKQYKNNGEAKWTSGKISKLFNQNTTIDEVLQKHLNQQITIGSYPYYQINGDPLWFCRYIMIDIDDHDQEDKLLLVKKLNTLSKKIKEDLIEHYGISNNDILRDFSGRGYHIWIKFRTLTPLERVWDLVKDVEKRIKEVHNLDVEIFPKQPTMDSNSYGNCCKLPLSINRNNEEFCKILDGFDLSQQGDGYEIVYWVPKFEPEIKPKKEIKQVDTTPTLDDTLLKIRQEYKDILTGKLEIHDYCNKVWVDKNPKNYEFRYWKSLIAEIEAYGLTVEDIKDLLLMNQPNFDYEKTIQQLKAPSHQDRKPLTKSVSKKYFPDYYQEKEKKEAKKLTQKEIKKCEKYLGLQNEKYDLINEVIDFYVKGLESQNQAKLILFLKLGDILSKDLISKIDFHGDPSSGKSYICDRIIQLLPEENYLMFNAGSDKALWYDQDFTEDIKFIYLKELTRNSSNMTEFFKALYDSDISYKVANFDKFNTDTITKARTGLLTTYSFEYTQRDSIDRSWVLIPDQSHTQNERVMKYRLERRRNRIQVDFDEIKIKEKMEFFKDIIRVLRDLIISDNIRVQIPYSDQIKSLFQKEQLRVRRDIDKLPDLIEIITYFNHKNRDILEFNGKKYIFSQYEDLRYSLEIGLEYFLDVSQNIDEIQKEILDFMKFKEIKEVEEYNEDIKRKETILKQVDREYTTKEINDNAILHKSVHSNTIRNKLKGLIANNYIELTNKEKGKANKYKKLKDYDTPNFPLEDVKEEINESVQKSFEFWKNKTSGDS